MKKGFTLLEILLVIAAIGVLAAIVIIAINPQRQLAQVRDGQRQQDLNTIYKAISQYQIDNAALPGGITDYYQEVCVTGASDCTGRVDLSALDGVYLPSVPVDPTISDANGTGYYVKVENNRVQMQAIGSENEPIITVNDELPNYIGRVWSTGENNDGELGRGSNGASLTSFQRSPIDIRWRKIQVGDDAGVGLDEQRNLYTWGESNQGELADGTTGTRPTPTQVGTDEWSEISFIEDHGVAVRSDSTLWAWGENGAGQVGNNSTSDVYSMVQIGSATWIDASAGYNHSLGVQSDGTLWAWGDNSQYQLGDGTTNQSLVPIQVGSDTDWRRVWAGERVSFAEKSNGDLYSWGDGANYRSGQGVTSDTTTPTLLISGLDILEIDTENEHVVLLTTNQELYCWGEGSDGRCLTGSNADVTTPTQVASGLISACTGRSHTITITNEGDIEGFGNADGGALGNGQTSGSFPDAQITTGNFASVYCGDSSSHALSNS